MYNKVNLQSIPADPPQVAKLIEAGQSHKFKVLQITLLDKNMWKWCEKPVN